MTTTISDKAKALLILQTRLDDANKRVALEMKQHLYQLEQLREAIIARDTVEANLTQYLEVLSQLH